MTPVNPNEALWEINNEYRKRLSLLMGHMKLLEHLLHMQGNVEPALQAAIRRVRVTLEDIDADHHEWRHAYYYQVPDGGHKRRMVSHPQAVQLALQTFSAMLSEHLAALNAIAATVRGLPRPAPSLTRVIKGGDLWQMCLEGLESLATYDQFVRDELAGQSPRLRGVP